jgi:hypothetical protein
MTFPLGILKFHLCPFSCVKFLWLRYPTSEICETRGRKKEMKADILCPQGSHSLGTERKLSPERELAHSTKKQLCLVNNIPSGPASMWLGFDWFSNAAGRCYKFYETPSGDSGSLSSQCCIQVLGFKEFSLLSPFREKNYHLETSNWGRLAIHCVEMAKEVAVNWIRNLLHRYHIVTKKDSKSDVLNRSLWRTVCWHLNLLVNNLPLTWFIVILFICTTL